MNIIFWDSTNKSNFFFFFCGLTIVFFFFNFFFLSNYKQFLEIVKLNTSNEHNILGLNNKSIFFLWVNNWFFFFFLYKFFPIEL